MDQIEQNHSNEYAEAVLNPADDVTDEVLLRAAANEAEGPSLSVCDTLAAGKRC
jgi:hypothetical protein